MKGRALATVLATGALVFALALMPGVTAKASSVVRGEVTMAFDFAMCPATCHWQGTLTGDIEGQIQLWETSANFFPGKTEHFFEDLTITSEEGGTVTGLNAGVFNFVTLKFQSKTVIEAATGDLAYLQGYEIHFSGFTSQFPPPAGTSVVTGTAAWFAVPT